MAMLADVVGTLDLDAPQRRQNLFRPHLMKASLMATAASHLTLCIFTRIQQLFQNRRSRPMHGCSCGHLQGFQIDTSFFA
jgi:hypothetical protein